MSAKHGSTKFLGKRSPLNAPSRYRPVLCCPLAQFPAQLYYDAVRRQLIEGLGFASTAMRRPLSPTLPHHNTILPNTEEDTTESCVNYIRSRMIRRNAVFWRG